MMQHTCIRSLIEYEWLPPRNPFSALPHALLDIPLYQNIFRGEPAISKFVWHIASYLRSSQPIATDTGAGLQSSFDDLHPAQGKLTWFRVYYILLTPS